MIFFSRPLFPLLVALTLPALPARGQVVRTHKPKSDALSGFVVDSFSGNPGTALESHTGEIGASWTVFSGTTPNGKISPSGMLYPTLGSGTQYYASGVALSPDQKIQAEFFCFDSTPTVISLILRWDLTQGVQTCYEAQWDGLGSQWVIQRVSGGGVTTLATNPDTLNPGDRRHVEFRCIGTALSLQVNGVVVAAAFDSTITVAGVAGVTTYGLASPTTGVQLDRFLLLDALPPRAPVRLVQRRFEPRANERHRILLSRPRNPDPPFRLPGTPQGIRFAGRRRPRVIILPPPSFGLVLGISGTVGTPIGNTVTGRRNWTYLGKLSLFTPSVSPPAHVFPVLRAAPPPPDPRRLRVVLTRVPPRTLRLAAFQTDITVLRRDERRFAGAVWASRVPAATVRQLPFNEDILVLRPPQGEGRRGQVYQSLPHRATDPRPRKAPLLAASTPPRPGGSVWQNRVPDRTLRLDSFAEDITVVRRDERRYPGAVLLTPVHRPGAALIVPVLPRETVVRRDERRYPGAVWANRVPARTLRLGSFALDVTVVRRDERRYAGAVLLQRLPPATQRQDAFNEDILVIKRDERRFAGRVFLGLPSRTGALVITPRVPRLLTVRRDERGTTGRGLVLRVPDRTVRLDSFQTRPLVVVQRDQRATRGNVALGRVLLRTVTQSGFNEDAQVYRRDERRYPGAVLLSRLPRAPVVLAPSLPRPSLIRSRPSFPFAGRVVWVQPGRLRVVPRLPRNLIVRRDERGYAGRTAFGPVSRQNAIAVLHGNPRAKVTLRPGPVATLTLTEG